MTTRDFERLLAELSSGADEKYDKAEQIAIDADRWDWVHFFRALRRQMRDDFQGAIEEYRLALRVRPDFAGAYTNIGNCYVALKDNKQAIHWYDEYFRNYSLAANAVIFDNRGKALFALGETDAAIADMLIAIERDPGYENAYRDYIAAGIQLLDIRRFERATSLYRERFGSKPDGLVSLGEAYSEFAVRLLDRGQPAQVQHYIERALEIAPESGGVMINTGYVRDKLGDTPGALALYEKAAGDKQTTALAHLNIAGLHARAGQITEALTHLRTAVALDPQVKELAKTDSDFVSLRDNADFEYLISAGRSE